MLRESVCYFDVLILFLMRIFRSSVVGHECFFKCCAMELLLERLIVRLLDRVVEVKPSYVLLYLEIESPKGHLNWHITLIFCKTPIYIYIFISITMYLYVSLSLSLCLSACFSLSPHLHTHIHTHTHTHTHIYIYIYRERERDLLVYLKKYIYTYQSLFLFSSDPPFSFFLSFFSC